jgi:DNA-binding NarL/FixJ family response regulator
LKVLIADDQQTIRIIGDALARRDDLEVVATSDGIDASELLLDAIPPDVAILNCSLPNADGIELCRKLVEHHNDTYTHIILVSNGNIEEVFKSLASGFNNILVKPFKQEELHEMMDGFSQENDLAVGGKDGQLPVSDSLTNRQREILALLGQGYSNNEIAEKLGVSVGTIKSHIHHIFDKLSAESRTKAVVKAQQLGLI